MTATDELLLVLELACLTNDRTTTEQRALLNTGVRVETALNKATNINLRHRGHDATPCLIVNTIEQTYNAEGRQVSLGAKTRADIDRRRTRFVEDHAAWLTRGGR